MIISLIVMALPVLALIYFCDMHIRIRTAYETARYGAEAAAFIELSRILKKMDKR